MFFLYPTLLHNPLLERTGRMGSQQAYHSQFPLALSKHLLGFIERCHLWYIFELEPQDLGHWGQGLEGMWICVWMTIFLFYSSMVWTKSKEIFFPIKRLVCYSSQERVPKGRRKGAIQHITQVCLGKSRMPDGGKGEHRLSKAGKNEAE